MEFGEKYISAKEAAINPDEKKIIISNEAYALAEVLHELNRKLGRVSEILNIK